MTQSTLPAISNLRERLYGLSATRTSSYVYQHLSTSFTSKFIASVEHWEAAVIGCKLHAIDNLKIIMHMAPVIIMHMAPVYNKCNC